MRPEGPKKIFFEAAPHPLSQGLDYRPPPPPLIWRSGLNPPMCMKLFAWLLCEEQTNQEREVQRLLQSWFKTTCIVFYNNIPAGQTSLLQVYRCYWAYVAMKPTMRQTSHANDLVNAKSHAREKPLLAAVQILLPFLDLENTKTVAP